MPSVASAMLRWVSLRRPMRTGTPVKTWYIVQLLSLSIRLPYWVSSVSETGAPPSFSQVSILSTWRRCSLHVSMVLPFVWNWHADFVRVEPVYSAPLSPPDERYAEA
ncbi:hypothetical protein CEV33_4763 [Brucella grignonensis]|uniref:Uncharacterized protein n=1 Tax=Brucella grignonensis TaxID=94627 RepID=A0A256G366_9HYPH|nr:hypothetical protein CEV33_4763 [Brucella grignonensis]